LSFGQDPNWRRFLVDRVPVGPDAHVLDVATGTAAVAIELAQRTGCRVTGLDQSPDMLAHGRRAIDAAGLSNRITLMQGEAERLPFPDASFDALTFTYLLRYVSDPGATLRELARVVRTGGVIASLEFGVPPSLLPRLGWKAFTGVIAPIAGRAMSPGWGHAMSYLRTSIPDFWRSHPMGDVVDMHRAAGIEDLRVKRLTFGAAVVIWGVRRT
jgi:demethylmenaquinone methyltransferase / 2-methoxy-6-polyprenyl-1,4-benzoquinol methylase